MRTTIQILGFFIIMISCKKNTDYELYSMKNIDINSIPNKTNEMVLISFPEIIFIKTDINETIARPNYDDLINLHVKYYSSQNVNSFLYNVLNLKMKIPIEYINTLKIRTFNLDNSVKNQIYNLGIHNFISTITEERNNKKILKSNFAYGNEDATFEYILYINKFVVIKDDYTALSWIEKKDELQLYIK